tara:strand:- start:411 stop:524 length:114 start_codon:yes stop_codon:yes gene_type:complete
MVFSNGISRFVSLEECRLHAMGGKFADVIVSLYQNSF